MKFIPDLKLYITDEQHLSTLKRMRDLIAKGRKLTFYDCEEIGNKNTDCSWGLCTNDPSFWKKDELLFPERGSINGEESSKYQQNHQHCPFDKRNDEESSWGCFYHCRIFGKEKISRKRALKLYDEKINK